MTGVVIDNSAAVILTAKASLGQDNTQHYAPELIDLEFANTLRKLVLRGKFDEEEAKRYIDDWSANSLIRCDHTMLLNRVWELRNNITPYDAAYVALAEALEVPLVTGDLRLARAAAPYCDVVTVSAA